GEEREKQVCFHFSKGFGACRLAAPDSRGFEGVGLAAARFRHDAAGAVREAGAWLDGLRVVLASRDADGFRG
ncbi:unnamed protein product, partial [Prorocentrum cordatum]